MDEKPTWHVEFHLEWSFHATRLPEFWSEECPEGQDITFRFLSLLGRHGVKAHFYVLGHVAEYHPKLIETIEKIGHPIGSHGYWHRHNEWEGDASDQLARTHLPAACQGYRSPFWDTTPRPGLAGGFFFRVLPYKIILQEIRKTGIMYLHPHDLYHQSRGPLRRRVGQRHVWDKLDRILTEASVRNSSR